MGGAQVGQRPLCRLHTGLGNLRVDQRGYTTIQESSTPMVPPWEKLSTADWTRDDSLAKDSGLVASPQPIRSLGTGAEGSRGHRDY